MKHHGWCALVSTFDFIRFEITSITTSYRQIFPGISKNVDEFLLIDSLIIVHVKGSHGTVEFCTGYRFVGNKRGKSFFQFIDVNIAVTVVICFFEGLEGRYSFSHHDIVKFSYESG